MNLRAPPHNLEAERSVLGSVLLHNDCLDDIPQLRPEHFYLAGNRDIFAALLSLRRRDQPCDAVTLATELERASTLSAVGGLPYLHELLSTVPHSAHARYYAGIVTERAWRRAIIAAGHDATQQAFDDSVDVDEIVTGAEGQLHGILEERLGSLQTAVPMGDVMAEAWAAITAEQSPGVSTGYAGLDQLTLGLQPGNLIVLAARPSVGKTSFAANMAWHVAQGGVPVLFHSLEQSRLELAERFLSSASGVPSHALRTRHLSEEQREAVMESAAELGQLPIVMDDHPRNMAQIHAAARLHRRKASLGLLVIDYIQLIEPEDRRAPREQQVADVSRSLKRLAKSLEIPVIVLAQLNREIEKRPDKRPRLSDLRESGSIEQDADLILFLDRPATYDEHADQCLARIHIAKHRNGRTGIVELRWDGETMTFSGLEQASAEQYGFFSDQPIFDGQYGQ